MRILFLNTYDNNGGAAVACKRLAKSLTDYGHQVDLYCLHKTSQNTEITGIKTNLPSQLPLLLEKIHFLKHQKNNKTRFLFSSNLFPLNHFKKIPFNQYDIIHLHWVNQGFLSNKDLLDIMNINKPIFWTLHDMWNMTGGCHYNNTCFNYIEGCSNCPLLKIPSKEDLSKKLSRYKKELYSKKNINFITCSSWLKETALESNLLKNQNIKSIPNPINIKEFKPTNNKKHNKRITFMFQASNISDNRKGFPLLLNALKIITKNHLDVIKKIQFTIIGKSKEHHDFPFPFPIRETGFIKETERLIEEYNKVDFYVTPALQDNLPNSVMEALACGVPVIAFKIGGIPEMVQHEFSGYITDSCNSEALAKTIVLAVEQFKNHNQLSTNARNHVIEHYSSYQIAKKHTSLYQEAM